MCLLTYNNGKPKIPEKRKFRENVLKNMEELLFKGKKIVF